LRIQRWSGALYCNQHPGETLLVIVLEGTVQVPGTGKPLAPLEAVRLDAPQGERREITAPGLARVAQVRISPA
jgi:hypothetical protein